MLLICTLDVSTPLGSKSLIVLIAVSINGFNPASDAVACKILL